MRALTLLVLLACIIVVFVCTSYFLFLSPSFAAKVADSSFLVSHLPKSLRREMAGTLISDAVKKEERKDYKANIERLKEAAKMDPTHLKVWWKLCDSYEHTNELDLALDACRHEADLSPDEFSYLSLGDVYMARKEHSLAVQAFETAGQKDPQFCEVTVRALLVSGQYEEAIPAAQHAIDVSEVEDERLISDAMRATLKELAFAYQQTGQKKKAQETFKRLNNWDPTLHYHSCKLTNDGWRALSLECK